ETYQPDRAGYQFTWAELEALDERGLLVHHNDHWGLRIVRSGDQLLFFPRVCLHEGACLDQAAIRQERILCPWHGRAMQPIAMIHLSRQADGMQVTEVEHHRIKTSPQGIEVIFKVRSGQPVG
ncbi:MAG: Rieske 2Fe-2S domain-containing protein, partial [Leptolyngbyaceae cyanobacterium bins.59]|nr:Rieske 2Fe-2S domain-containing protein [Leptolyngbyaceae cyanobacterium bins.59]